MFASGVVYVVDLEMWSLGQAEQRKHLTEHIERI